jgi:hypothetical protein
MADEDLKAELEKLRAENAALKTSQAKGISMKVSEKGGLSIYGLGGFRSRSTRSSGRSSSIWRRIFGRS